MRRLCPHALLRVLGALPLVVLHGGCGLVLAFTDPPDAERRPPDSGPPVGGHDVVDWDGDAALDPRDGATHDAGRDAGVPLDGGARDGGDGGGGDGGGGDGGLDGGDGDGDGGLDGGAVDASADDAGTDGGALDGGNGALDAADLDDAGDGGEPFDGSEDGGSDGAPPQCGSLSLFATDFTSSTGGWFAEATNGVTVQHTGGEMRIDVPAKSTGSGTLRVPYEVSFRDEHVRVRFGALPEADRLVTTLTLYGPNPQEQYLRIRFNGQGYRAVLADVGVPDVVGPFDNDTPYPYWRIRHTASDQLRYQVSDDGSDYHTLLTVDPPPWIDHVRPVIRVDATGEGAVQSVRVDDIRGRLSAAKWCPLGGVVESFEGGLPLGFELAEQNNCDVLADDGSITFSQSANGVVDCRLRATAPRSLKGQSFVVKISDRPPSDVLDDVFDDTYAGLRIVLGATHELYLGIRDGYTRGTIQTLGGASSASIASVATPAPLVYLKLDVSADGSTASFSQSSDGVSYGTPLGQLAVPTLAEGVAELMLANFGNTTTSTSDGVAVTFEGVNAE